MAWAPRDLAWPPEAPWLVPGLLVLMCVHGVSRGEPQTWLISRWQDLGDELLFAKPKIFCHFAQGIGDAKYLPVTDVAHLNKILVDALDSYNEVNAVMSLVSGARADSTGKGPGRGTLASLLINA